MFDGNMASRVIHQTLTADTTLMALVSAVVEDIYGKTITAPSAAFPFIAFNVMNQEDQYYNGAVRSIVESQVLIRAIDAFDTANMSGDSTYSGAIQTIASRIDTLLHDKTIAIMDGAVQVGTATITRVSPFRERYLDGSVEYRHLGGVYHINTNE